MVCLTTWLLALNALSLTPPANAWTFTWRNSTAGASIVHETGAQNCTQIWAQKGEEFDWVPEGPWCLNLYKDATCSGDVVGWECSDQTWRKDASLNLSAFSVYAMPPASASIYYPSTSTTPTSTPAPTSTTISSSSITSTSTSTPTPSETAQPSSHSSSLSGGAIAGIAIGAIAAVVIVGALFFFMGRRNRRNAVPEAAAHSLINSPHPYSPVDPSAEITAEKKFNTIELAVNNPPPRPYTGSRFVELQGEEGGAELSNTHQMQELEATEVRPYRD